MATTLLLGPLLGYEDRDIYTICILLRGATTVPEVLTSVDAAAIAFQYIARVGNDTFWRAEVPIIAPAHDLTVDYTIRVGGQEASDANGRTAWRFHVPALSAEPKFAYASCNGFSEPDMLRDNADRFVLWREMRSRHEAEPFSLLLMGGDQVYADEVWSSLKCPRLHAWSELDSEAQYKASATAPMAKELAQFYTQLYISRWNEPDMSWMLACVPSVMMWDDHDIFDGWGSYPEERQNCRVFQAVFLEAKRAFDVFQLRCGTRNRLDAAAAHRTLRLHFRGHAILALDNRTERTREQVMGPGNWDAIKGWLQSLPSVRPKSLIVLTGVPMVYRSFASIEAAMEATPWHEELEDDVLDHWSASPHQAERMRLAMVLLQTLSDLKERHQVNTKGVILSGDVHIGAVGQLWWERRQVGLLQVVSSGIVHPPPTAFQWAAILAMTSDTPELLGDGEIEASMATPLGAPRYLRTRNFATLHLGTDDKIWVNWVCENPDIQRRRPSFAWS